MKGVRWGAVVLATLGVAWVVGRLLLEVEFPPRSGGAGIRPGSPEARPSLRQVYETLPVEGGGEAEVRLLDDNSEAWLARWRLLAGARQRLDISYFILKQDIFGAAFLGHLVQKSREGVEIRLLLDALGTRMARSFQGNDYLDALVKADLVEVRIFRPLPFRYLDAFLTLNPAAVLASEHDKILLADGTSALIGGRNIAHEYFISPKADPLAFRDTDVLLFGAAAAAPLARAFEAQYGSGPAHQVTGEKIDLRDPTADLLLAYGAMDSWLRGEPLAPALTAAIAERDLPWLEELGQLPQLRGALQKRAPTPVSAEVRLLDSRSRLLEADDQITRSLIDLVRSAEREILIQSPYLVLPEEAVALLAEAAVRGVQLTILTNSPASSDNPMSQGVFLEQWPDLLARVPTLQLFVVGDQRNLHGKLAIFDGRLALVGTYNLDPLSMALNSELAAAIWSPQFAGELLERRRQLIAEGSPRIYQYQIARGPTGAPRRSADGRVEVEFGPEEHLTPEEMQGVQWYRRLWRWLWPLAGKMAAGTPER